MRKLLIAVIFILFCIILYRYNYKSMQTSDLVLYGNIDQRQVNLAFLDSGRVAEIYVEEGQIIHKGQILAKLETQRLENKIIVAQAATEGAQASYDKLINGSRPEEIAQAKANLNAANADLIYAENQYNRLKLLDRKNATSRADFEQATQVLSRAKASVELANKQLQILIIGPREEDIRQAKSLVTQNKALLIELENILEDYTLKSPADSIVNKRLLEVGDIATPQKSLFSLGILSPKWVRAYVSENQLALLKYGMKVIISNDTYPDKKNEGKLSFISSVAEFTPKSVQTEDLRTSLVYEIRIFFDDKDNILHTGMPVTLNFPEILSSLP